MLEAKEGIDEYRKLLWAAIFFIGAWERRKERRLFSLVDWALIFLFLFYFQKRGKAWLRTKAVCILTWCVATSFQRVRTISFCLFSVSLQPVLLHFRSRVPWWWLPELSKYR
jgi:hypothetical protein